MSALIASASVIEKLIYPDAEDNGGLGLLVRPSSVGPTSWKEFGEELGPIVVTGTIECRADEMAFSSDLSNTYA